MPLNIKLTDHAPIYQQIQSAIRAAIEAGQLQPGEKLPTVRELSAKLGIASGTIRHAYDRLAHEGLLQMAQGKGTFVLDTQPDAPMSREKQAMDAIGALLDQLSALNFSTREMQMYFTLKLGERTPVVILTPIAVVDCNDEVLSEIMGQLSGISGIELTEHLLEDARRAPMEMLRRYPLIITTQTHYHEVCSLLGDQACKVLRAVLAPSQQTMIALARIEAGSGVGIYCRSIRFAEIIRKALRLCPHLHAIVAPHLFAGGEQPLEEFLPDKQTLLVSPDYLTYASAQDQGTLRAFAERGGQIIPYHYRIDQGSYLNIEERIQEVLRQQ